MFLDVREEWEHEESNIGATCMPLHSLPQCFGELGDRGREIIVHCKSGTRGNQARKFLAKQGFTNVRNLTGGIEAFRKLVQVG